MTVKEIVAAWLKEHGYDGLCHESCGCGMEDLISCGECPDECVHAYRHKSPCNQCGDLNICNDDDVDSFFCEQKRKDDSDHD